MLAGPPEQHKPPESFEDRRRRFFEGVHASQAAVRADPEAWSRHQAAMELWDDCLTDGLEKSKD